MAIASGPRGINDGLIYFIDPSNVKSYAGVGTVIYDLSGNGKTSYFTNGALYQNYQKGVVLVDGNNDYISTPLFNLTSPVTVSAWVKNVAADGTVFGSTSGYGNAYYIFGFNGKTVWIQGEPGGYQSFEFPNFLTNSWFHLSMTRDVGNNIRVYFNGVASSSNPRNYSNTLKITQIGRYSNFTNQYNTRGSIGEVRIYNRALSQQEIINNYNSSRKKYLTSEEYVKDSLVLNLDFANPLCYSGAGNTAYDLSGFGHTAYLVNGATYFMGYGGFISCDGVDDYIEVPTTSNLVFGSENFSVEYWYRKTEYTLNYENIWGVSKWNTGANPGTNEWDLAIGNGFSSSIGETVGFGIESGSTIYSTGPLPASYNLNKFNHLVGIRNNNQLQVYYNGQQIYSNTPVGMTTSTSVNNVNRNLRVSNSALNQYYSRAISGVVRVYRKALTADEVRQNYRALLPRFSDTSIVTDGLVLNVDFGTVESYPGSGTLVRDISTGKTANLQNTVSYNTNYGGNLNLNGGNFNFSASSDFFFGTGDFTVEAWFTWDGTYANTGRVIYANNGSGSLEQLGIFQGYGIYAAGLTVNQFPATNTIQHIIGTRISGVSYMYLNGLLIGSGAVTSSIGVTANTFSVGYRYTDSQHPWKGDLPILRIYKGRGFTQSDVSQNFNAMRNRFSV